ncbi:MAG: hypothetical protein AAF267_20585 [Deinococcota bacterium]
MPRLTLKHLTTLKQTLAGLGAQIVRFDRKYIYTDLVTLSHADAWGILEGN